MLHEESPKNLGLFLHQEAQELFNITSTFSRYSHFPITLQYLSSLEALTGELYIVGCTHISLVAPVTLNSCSILK